MANYRNIYSRFWSDEKLEDASHEERYFFLYLLTNTHTNLCGCYELTPKQICNEADFDDKEVVNSLLQSLINTGFIKYDFTTREVLIKNWSKYNWTASAKLHAPIVKQIIDIKSDELKNDMVSICQRYGIDTVLYGMHTSNIHAPVYNNLFNNIPSAHEHAPARTREYFESVKELCKQHCPVIYDRHMQKPNADYGLGIIIDEIMPRYNLVELEAVFKHTAKTYFIKPKMQNCDLCWLLNNLEKIKKTPEESQPSAGVVVTEIKRPGSTLPEDIRERIRKKVNGG